MNTPVTLLLLLLLLFIWLFIRRRQAASMVQEKPSVPVSQKNTVYHAVSIKFESNACMAAREMEGMRFLSAAAPRLPLPDCNVLECNCRFVHHKDRRSGKDRRSPFAASGFGGGTGSFEQEKRKGRDRRSHDDRY
ncbi:MAG: hypothetical protein GTO71_02985 [Woeseiaceae bacterium]|nr:hypothetical protein [Woeseiaceae bacterium]NIP20076.1 hypothetical protein [Woeseiaceae bacterium]NIS88872.1 hypothetical protein [Woeseiaceae bacterium]